MESGWGDVGIVERFEGVAEGVAVLLEDLPQFLCNVAEELSPLLDRGGYACSSIGVPLRQAVDQGYQGQHRGAPPALQLLGGGVVRQPLTHRRHAATASRSSAFTAAINADWVTSLDSNALTTRWSMVGVARIRTTVTGWVWP